MPAFALPRTNVLVLSFSGILAACSNMQMGLQEAKTTATRSAGGATSQNANAQLKKCDATLGTIALVEDTSAPWYGMLTS